VQNRASPTGRACSPTRLPSCICTASASRGGAARWVTSRVSAQRSTTHSPPLAGVRVLDLTRLLPGPMCTLYLADLGADVVKVEDTGAGDYARTLALRPASKRDRTTAWFNAINRNKRSMAVDLKSPGGHAAFLALASAADV